MGAAGLSCTASSKSPFWAFGARGGLSIFGIFKRSHKALLAALGGCVLEETPITVGGEGVAFIRICNEGQKSMAISALVARKFKLYNTSPGVFALKVTCSRVMVALLP